MSDKDVALVLCDCNGKLRQRLDFNRLEKELSALDAVQSVTVCSDLCSADERSAAVAAAIKAGARRLVVGACRREVFEDAFRALLKEKQLNEALWWPVNICEQCALVHADKRAATGKALARLTAAVDRVACAVPLASSTHQVRRDVAVVGGGVAGLQAALALAGLGHAVVLIHRDGDLGGTARGLPELYGYVSADPESAAAGVREAVDTLVGQVEADKSIRLCTGAALKSAAGELGNFLLRIGLNGEEQEVEAGAIVLATGFCSASAADAAGVVESPKIVDMPALVEMIRAGNVPARVAIVVDLVAEQGRAVSAQVLSAAELLGRAGVEVKVYCRNVRVAAAGQEALYRRARAAGAVIAKYDDTPTISVDSSKVLVSSVDPVVGVKVADGFDLIVLADLPPAETADARCGVIKGLQPGPEGALQFDDVWLLPTETNRPGVFVVGAARGNSEYRDALNDGLAVAEEIHELLADDCIETLDDAATVDVDKCVLCLTCVRVCPHAAISIDRQKEAAAVSLLSCQRCGICAAECPAKAITLPGFSDEQVVADVGEKPQLTVFACENSAIPAAEAAAGSEYGVAAQIVRVPCAGKVDPQSVLTALEKGADRVLILGCHPDSCQYLSGSTRAAKRAEQIAAALARAGVDGSRVRFGGIASVEPGKFVEYVSATE